MNKVYAEYTHNKFISSEFENFFVKLSGTLIFILVGKISGLVFSSAA